MNKYLKMIVNTMLYYVAWFLGFKIFGYLIGLSYNSPLKNMMNILLNQWGFWVVPFFGIPALIGLFYLKVRGENIVEFCRFKTMSARDTLIVIFVAFAGILFTMHLINTSFFIKNLPEFNGFIENVIKGNLFATLFMVGILMPACEEIILRGLIFSEMRKCLPMFVVLFLHTLGYMLFQPNLTIAAYAYLNFTVYALVYIFTDSLWASIMFQSLGTVGLYSTKLLGIDLVIRNLGDTYLITATIISLLLVLIGVFSLKKSPLKEIFARNPDNL